MSSRAAVAAFLDRPAVSRFIIAVILINAVTLGLETFPEVMARAGTLILAVDRICLGIFVVELALRLFAQGLRFFRSGWNIFDFTIVAISLLPATGSFSVLRAMRILRVLRVVSAVPSLRRVVDGLGRALPGMGSVFLLILIIYYIAAVMATKLFGASFPQWFGSLTATSFTLFQIMTLEGWSDGIVRPVLEVHGWAWIFFLPFIVVTSFAVLNLFIGVIVSALQDTAGPSPETAELRSEIQALRSELRAALQALERTRSETPRT